MDLVLNKEVDQWHKGTEECRGQVFSVFNGLRVGGAERNTAGGPRKRRDNV